MRAASSAAPLVMVVSVTTGDGPLAIEAAAAPSAYVKTVGLSVSAVVSCLAASSIAGTVGSEFSVVVDMRNFVMALVS